MATAAAPESALFFKHEPWQELRHEFQPLLGEFLQSGGAITAAEAARRLDARFAALAVGEAEKNPKKNGSVTGLLWDLWGDVFTIAEQVPYTHPAMDRFVQLFPALRGLPARQVICEDKKVSPRLRTLSFKIC